MPGFMVNLGDETANADACNIDARLTEHLCSQESALVNHTIPSQPTASIHAVAKAVC